MVLLRTLNKNLGYVQYMFFFAALCIFVNFCQRFAWFVYFFNNYFFVFMIFFALLVSEINKICFLILSWFLIYPGVWKFGFHHQQLEKLEFNNDPIIIKNFVLSIPLLDVAYDLNDKLLANLWRVLSIFVIRITLCKFFFGNCLYLVSTERKSDLVKNVKTFFIIVKLMSLARLCRYQLTMVVFLFSLIRFRKSFGSVVWNQIRVLILVMPKQEVGQKSEWFCRVKFSSTF